MPVAYHIAPLGDQGLVVELGSEIYAAVNDLCVSLARRIAAAGIPGITDIIPAYASVAVLYDAVQVQHVSGGTAPSLFVSQKIEALFNEPAERAVVQGRQVVIPACFDSTHGPDLEAMANLKSMKAAELVQQFVEDEYRVYMLGFLPGFPYMGRVKDALAMPRKEKPVLHIAAGSIGIAGNQCGIYPLDSPGGWTIIGRTPLKMFDVTASEPCLLQPGDIVRFEPIGSEAFHQLNQHT